MLDRKILDLCAIYISIKTDEVIFTPLFHQKLIVANLENFPHEL